MNHKSLSIRDRLPIPDVMRGFALCGILSANLMSFTGFYSLSLNEVQLLPVFDRLTLFLIDWLVEGKFYAIFSILFGAGFALQADHFSKTGKQFSSFWRRRMFILMCIGLMHMYLIWHGDILTLYSLLGFLLLLFIRKPNQQLLFWIGLLLVMPVFIHTLLFFSKNHWFWFTLSHFTHDLKVSLGYEHHSLLNLRTSSSPSDVFYANILSSIPRPMAYLQTGRPFQVFGQFLIGVYLARQFLIQTENKLSLAFPKPKVITLFFLSGLLMSFIYAIIKALSASPFLITPLGLFQGIVYHAGSTLLALGYIGLIAKLHQKGYLQWLSQKLAELGRMSLTHYLSQTTICVCLFYGYGLALMGKLPYVSIPLLTLLILFLQGLWGHYWLLKKSQGPMEWLWRKVSYPSSAGR